MTRRSDPEPLSSRSSRGSALILVLLLTLALSAIGMVALRDVSASVEQSGTYRTRTTAAKFGEAAAQFWLANSASGPEAVVKSMEQGDGCRDAMNVTGDVKWSQIKEKLGGCAVYDASDSNTFSDTLDMTSEESGLFFDQSQGDPSFEARQNSTFRVIVRFPYEVPISSGQSKGNSTGRKCYKMATVATEAQLGQFPNNWTEPGQVGRGRTVFEARLGPVDCGTN